MKGLNSNHLKIIAILAMTIDHFTWLAFPGTQIKWYVLALHAIGRITAPIMWYFIVEGYNHTKDMKKYLLRLFIFAIISHFAYCFAFDIPFMISDIFNATSVMWSLFWSVVMLNIVNNKELDSRLKILLGIIIFLITFPSDWSCIPVFVTLFMNKYRDNFNKQMLFMMIGTIMYAIVYYLFLDKVYGLLQLFTILSIPLLFFYNGKKGKLNIKYLFYIYYPLHLIIVGILRIYLYGDLSLIFK